MVPVDSDLFLGAARWWRQLGVVVSFEYATARDRAPAFDHLHEQRSLKFVAFGALIILDTVPTSYRKYPLTRRHARLAPSFGRVIREAPANMVLS